MLAYATGTDCLMHTLRQHLGDEGSAPCGHCGHCTGAVLELAANEGAEAWLASRPVAVRGFRKLLAEGQALYDSNRRSGLFLEFMRQRTRGEPAAHTLDSLRALAAAHPHATVVPLPSSTWAGREATLAALQLPVWDGLAWLRPPDARQGTLLNNDQRKANLREWMPQAKKRYKRSQKKANAEKTLWTTGDFKTSSKSGGGGSKDSGTKNTKESSGSGGSGKKSQ